MQFKKDIWSWLFNKGNLYVYASELNRTVPRRPYIPPRPGIRAQCRRGSITAITITGNSINKSCCE